MADVDAEMCVDWESKLLQCYEAEECIWNVSLQYYRNKHMPQNALDAYIA